LTGQSCVRGEHHSHYVNKAERKEDRRSCQISVKRT